MAQMVADRKEKIKFGCLTTAPNPLQLGAHLQNIKICVVKIFLFLESYVQLVRVASSLSSHGQNQDD